MVDFAGMFFLLLLMNCCKTDIAHRLTTVILNSSTLIYSSASLEGGVGSCVGGVRAERHPAWCSAEDGLGWGGRSDGRSCCGRLSTRRAYMCVTLTSTDAQGCRYFRKGCPGFLLLDPQYCLPGLHAYLLGEPLCNPRWQELSKKVKAGANVSAGREGVGQRFWRSGSSRFGPYNAVDYFPLIFTTTFVLILKASPSMRSVFHLLDYAIEVSLRCPSLERQPLLGTKTHPSAF